MRFLAQVIVTDIMGAFLDLRQQDLDNVIIPRLLAEGALVHSDQADKCAALQLTPLALVSARHALSFMDEQSQCGIARLAPCSTSAVGGYLKLVSELRTRYKVQRPKADEAVATAQERQATPPQTKAAAEAAEIDAAMEAAAAEAAAKKLEDLSVKPGNICALMSQLCMHLRNIASHSNSCVAMPARCC